MLRRLLEASIRHSGREASQNGEPWLSVHWARGLSSRSGSGKRPVDNRRSKGGDASIRQKRLASEVRAVVTTGLQQGARNAPLLQRCGFQIEEVCFFYICILSLNSLWRTYLKPTCAYVTKCTCSAFRDGFGFQEVCLLIIIILSLYFWH